MHIENEVKLDFKDVLIRPKRSTLSSRSNVDLIRPFTLRNSKVEYSGVPIIAANMDTTGTFEMADALGKYDLSVALHKHYSEDEYVAYFNGLKRKSTAFYSMGITDSDLKKFKAVMERAPGAIEYLCIDVANGYTEIFVDFVSKIREEFPHLAIMAGNVVTGDMTEELILAGADIVKVGIGPGSVCSDGGCTRPGDIAKAFGGGADFVMLGGMLAGHNESGGEVIEKDGKVFRSFYGMSSKSAMDKYSGGVAKYRAAEGKTVYLEDRGPVADTVQEILGGVRSACTYVGARRLKELTKRTTFVRVTQQLNEVFGKS